MSTSITSNQGQGLRLAGYFTFIVALLSTFQWISTICRDYVMEHRWPASSGVITGRHEVSREVIPPSIRQRSYLVYRADFDVNLNLPADRCPGGLLILSAQPVQCLATVSSPETKSRASAIQWLRHHPLDSTMTVHYDLARMKTFAGGESVIDLYPWNEIGTTAIITALGLMLLAISRKLPAIADGAQAKDGLTTLSIE
jgi:hypothetical protein